MILPLYTTICNLQNPTKVRIASDADDFYLADYICIKMKV
jgi:hypothetical protein